MRLLSYYIENYGKIHQQDGVFEEGLTICCEGNGFGKSTLVSFIKAMFYGLASYTATTKEFVDRKHYYPFEGGKFGGNLTFEWQGKVYKIERFFDKKSAKGDECTVYQNGVVYTGFGEEIGKSIFGVDEESFIKTLFITAEDIEVSSTHSINEKLNRTLDGGLEENDFEGAMDALDKLRKEYKPSRGSGGKINADKAEIHSLMMEIRNYETMEGSLSESYRERESLTQRKEKLEGEYQEATARNVLLQKWETYDSMVAKRKAREEELAILNARYPNGIPTEEERKRLQEDLENTARLETRLKSATPSTAKELEWKLLEKRFLGGVPNPSTMGEMQERINRLNIAKGERERWMSETSSEKEETLKRKFAGAKLTEEDWREKRVLVEEYKRKQALWKQASERFFTPPKKKFNVKLYALILGATLLCTGLGLLFVIQALGIGLMIGGGIFLLIGSLIKSVNADIPPSNEMDVATLQVEITLLEEKMRSFTAPYGYYSEGGVLYDFLQMEEDYKAYLASLALLESRKEKVKQITLEMQTLEEEVQAFLHRYGERTDNPQTGLQQLHIAITSYQTLGKDRASMQEESEGIKRLLEETQSAVGAFLEKYGFPENVGTMYGLNALNREISLLEHTQADLQSVQAELADFKERHQLSERPASLARGTEEVYRELSLLRGRLADCDKKIAEIERHLERKEDAVNGLALAEDDLEDAQETYSLLVDTMEALENAEQRLKDAYIAPIKSRFSVYAEGLERVLDEKVSIDQDFRIIMERGGQSRSDRHLSAGERSLCALCMRLALIDNLYDGEKIFLLMDDPFVHLDDIHLKRTKELMRELSKTHQILYFCCHESRLL